MAWPTHFAPTAKELGSFSGSAEEFRAYASGLRLYFGTGYSLALISFAIPAVIALPAPKGKAGAGKPEGEGRKDEGTNEFLQQFVFSKAELGMLVSVLSPFLTTLAGAAIQL